MTTQTKEVTTPLGNKFVLNTSITYGQHREIMDIYLNEGENKALTIRQAEKKGFEFVLVSINDKKENLYEELSALPYSDIVALVEEVRSIVSPKV